MLDPFFNILIYINRQLFTCAYSHARANNIIIELITSQNDIATFIYAINSIRKSVRLAQVVEQWTGNPEVGGSSPRLTL